MVLPGQAIDPWLLVLSSFVLSVTSYTVQTTMLLSGCRFCVMIESVSKKKLLQQCALPYQFVCVIISFCLDSDPQRWPLLSSVLTIFSRVIAYPSVFFCNLALHGKIVFTSRAPPLCAILRHLFLSSLCLLVIFVSLFVYHLMIRMFLCLLFISPSFLLG